MSWFLKCIHSRAESIFGLSQHRREVSNPICPNLEIYTFKVMKYLWDILAQERTFQSHFLSLMTKPRILRPIYSNYRIDEIGCGSFWVETIAVAYLLALMGLGYLEHSLESNVLRNERRQARRNEFPRHSGDTCSTSSVIEYGQASWNTRWYLLPIRYYFSRGQSLPPKR